MRIIQCLYAIFSIVLVTLIHWDGCGFDVENGWRVASLCWCLPLMQHPVQGGGACAPDRSGFPAPAGAPVGAFGVEKLNILVSTWLEAWASTNTYIGVINLRHTIEYVLPELLTF